MENKKKIFRFLFPSLQFGQIAAQKKIIFIVYSTYSHQCAIHACIHITRVCTMPLAETTEKKPFGKSEWASGEWVSERLLNNTTNERWKNQQIFSYFLCRLEKEHSLFVGKSRRCTMKDNKRANTCIDIHMCTYRRIVRIFKARCNSTMKYFSITIFWWCLTVPTTLF